MHASRNARVGKLSDTLGPSGPFFICALNKVQAYKPANASLLIEQFFAFILMFGREKAVSVT